MMVRGGVSVGEGECIFAEMCRNVTLAVVATLNGDKFLRRWQKNVGLVTNTEGTAGTSEVEAEEYEKHRGTGSGHGGLGQHLSCIAITRTGGLLGQTGQAEHLVLASLGRCFSFLRKYRIGREKVVAVTKSI